MQLELGGTAGGQSWLELSDVEFLRAVSWKRGTAAEITAAAKKGDLAAFVAALSANWQSAAKLEAANSAVPCKAVWSLPAFAVSEREQALATILSATAKSGPKHAIGTKSNGQKAVDQLDTWWQQAAIQTSPLSMWEYLALLETLPNRIAGLTVPTAFAIWRTLLTVSTDLNQLAHVRDTDPNSAASRAELARYGFRADPFLDLSLLRNCELPWLAGVVFAAVKGSDKLRQAGAELLEHELVERTDDKGAPHADLLPRLPLWLAVSTRMLQSAERRQIEFWDADAADLYCSMIEKIAPIIQPDGHFALSHVQIPDSRQFAEEVLRTSGWSETEAALRALFTPPKRGARPSASKKSTPASRSATSRKTLPEICIAPVNQSDDAGWAVMRTHWGAHADRIIVTHDQPALNIEFTIQGRQILAGEWYSEISSGNQTTPLHGEWSCVCWMTDDESDYIELQYSLLGVVRSERQILLSRKDEFCFIAESLAEIRYDQFNYRTRLPLADGVKATTSATTREVRLDADGVPVRIFPVALPDQHVFSTPGRFGADLSLQTTASGVAWYNPMIIDWSPARRSATALWKSLTVAEEQKIVKPDVATGHRIKVGDHQWLIYRSLKQTHEARSVLGHQTRYETMIGSVEKNGDITPLMLVE